MLKIFTLTFISMIIGVFTWDFINLPYQNPENIVGILSKEKFNPINNDLRFIIFTSIVFLTFLSSLKYYSTEKKSFYELFIFKEEPFNIKKTENGLLTIYLFFIFLLFIEFILNDFPKHNLDFFHEGEWLTPAYHYVVTNEMWTGSLFIHGLFYDLIKPIISWNFFETISIGSVRFFDNCLVFIAKLGILLLSYQITKVQKFNEVKKIIFFTTITIVGLKLIKYGLGYNYFTYRDLSLLLILSLSINLLKNNFLNFTSSFFLGLLVPLSFFVTIDRGIYSLISLLLIIFLTLINKKYLSLLMIFFGFVFSIAFIIYIFPKEELLGFYENFSIIIKIKPFLDNYIYPTPFLGGDTISTKGLVSILLSGILVLLILMDKKKLIKNEFSLFLILCFFISVIVYKNALGRSDAAHIRYSLGFNHFLISICILNIVLSKIKLEKKLNKFLIFIPCFLMGISILFYNNNLSFKNLYNYKKKLTNYVYLEDKYFLKKEVHKVVKHYKNLSQKQDCAVAFTNEPAWPYLLRKKNCNKFYVNWFAATDNLQKKYIKDLDDYKVEFILFDSRNKLLPDGFINQERHNVIYNYIKKNYTYHSEVNGWIFYKRKNTF